MPIRSLINLVKTIRFNGGIWESGKSLFIRDSLKMGRLVGEDNYGNKYYENNNYFFGRNRWVHYADNVFLDYDGSQVPAEWFGWLHHRTDLTPCEEDFRPEYPWMACHTENMSGTREQWVPYSTTQPKIIPWKPPSKDDKPPKPCCFRPPKYMHQKPKEEEDKCCPPSVKKKDDCNNPPRVFH